MKIYLQNQLDNSIQLRQHVNEQNDQLVDEQGDVYKILNKQYKRYSLCYTVEPVLKNLSGGCQCDEQLLQTSYQKFLNSLDQQDRQGFKDLLTGQPDIDTDLIDSNLCNPEIRQKFKQSGISQCKLKLTQEQQLNTIFGKGKIDESIDFTQISNEQQQVSEKYFNMPSQDLNELKNQSIITQIKQATFDDENNAVINNTDNNDMFYDENEEQPVQQPLQGQGKKRRKYNKLYQYQVKFQDSSDFLQNGKDVFSFKYCKYQPKYDTDDKNILQFYKNMKNNLMSQEIQQTEIKPVEQQPQQKVVESSSSSISTIEESESQQEDESSSESEVQIGGNQDSELSPDEEYFP